MGSSSLTRDRTPGSLHWERGVLASGPLGMFPDQVLRQKVEPHKVKAVSVSHPRSVGILF